MRIGYDGRAVANFILDLCESKGRKVTNLDLQKIIYFCHVWSLIHLQKPLIRHRFEAWQYGPVLPYLYREFRNFDAAPITSRAQALDPRDGESKTVGYDFDSETESLLQRVGDFYSRMRTTDLVKLSHVDGGPWYKVWNHGGNVNPGMRIDDAEITEFYSKAVQHFPIQ
jgi:uncharacterized phage-associated protein